MRINLKYFPVNSGIQEKFINKRLTAHFHFQARFLWNNIKSNFDLKASKILIRYRSKSYQFMLKQLVSSIYYFAIPEAVDSEKIGIPILQVQRVGQVGNLNRNLHRHRLRNTILEPR